MAGATLTHVLDTNVFVQAHRAYYPFDVFPGFWECLEYHGLANRIISIDRVLKEIKDGNDELKTWAVRPALRTFFAPTDEVALVAHYREIIRWVDAHSQFTRAAKAEFGRAADGWVIAYAKVYGLTVATLETSDPNSKKKVKIPDVCIEFGVAHENTFDMLRALGARFVWTSPVSSP
jgi:Domain of unknown function (DUF4411)